MKIRFVTMVVVMWLSTRSDAGSFAVSVSQPTITGTIETATRLAEAKAWTEAFIRCGEGGAIRTSEPTVRSDRDTVSFAATFSCGPTGRPDLKQRIDDADVIVHGRVLEIVVAPQKEPISEHAANWRIATIQVLESLKGDAVVGAKLRVYFSSSDDVAWRAAPKLLVGEEGVWLAKTSKDLGGPKLVDPLDAHPVSHAGLIYSLVHSHT